MKGLTDACKLSCQFYEDLTFVLIAIVLVWRPSEQAVSSMRLNLPIGPWSGHGGFEHRSRRLRFLRILERKSFTVLSSHLTRTLHLFSYAVIVYNSCPKLEIRLCRHV
jgi:hypothetical protein